MNVATFWIRTLETSTFVFERFSQTDPRPKQRTMKITICVVFAYRTFLTNNMKYKMYRCTKVVSFYTDLHLRIFLRKASTLKVPRNKNSIV
jgi:hypothetical protein